MLLVACVLVLVDNASFLDRAGLHLRGCVRLGLRQLIGARCVATRPRLRAALPLAVVASRLSDRVSAHPPEFQRHLDDRSLHTCRPDSRLCVPQSNLRLPRQQCALRALACHVRHLIYCATDQTCDCYGSTGSHIELQLTCPRAGCRQSHRITPPLVTDCSMSTPARFIQIVGSAWMHGVESSYRAPPDHRCLVDDVSAVHWRRALLINI